MDRAKTLAEYKKRMGTAALRGPTKEQQRQLDEVRKQGPQNIPVEQYAQHYQNISDKFKAVGDKLNPSYDKILGSESSYGAGHEMTDEARKQLERLDKINQRRRMRQEEALSEFAPLVL